MFKKPAKKHNFRNYLLKNSVDLYSYPFLLLLTITMYLFQDVRLVRIAYLYVLEIIKFYLSYVPHPGPNLQPRHVPSPGVEIATFCFAG